MYVLFVCFVFAGRITVSPKMFREVSQNFPVFARPLTKTIVKRAFREEVENNQANTFEELNISPGDSGVSLIFPLWLFFCCKIFSVRAV